MNTIERRQAKMAFTSRHAELVELVKANGVTRHKTDAGKHLASLAREELGYSAKLAVIDILRSVLQFRRFER
jgi:hypothetical protein